MLQEHGDEYVAWLKSNAWDLEAAVDNLSNLFENHTGVIRDTARELLTVDYMGSLILDHGSIIQAFVEDYGNTVKDVLTSSWFQNCIHSPRICVEENSWEIREWLEETAWDNDLNGVLTLLSRLDKDHADWITSDIITWIQLYFQYTDIDAT